MKDKSSILQFSAVQTNVVQPSFDRYRLTLAAQNSFAEGWATKGSEHLPSAGIEL
jgi:hypothetical protein